MSTTVATEVPGTVASASRAAVVDPVDVSTVEPKTLRSPPVTVFTAPVLSVPSALNTVPAVRSAPTVVISFSAPTASLLHE